MTTSKLILLPLLFFVLTIHGWAQTESPLTGIIYSSGLDATTASRKGVSPVHYQLITETGAFFLVSSIDLSPHLGKRVTLTTSTLENLIIFDRGWVTVHDVSNVHAPVFFKAPPALKPCGRITTHTGTVSRHTRVAPDIAVDYVINLKEGIPFSGSQTEENELIFTVQLQYMNDYQRQQLELHLSQEVQVSGCQVSGYEHQLSLILDQIKSPTK